MITIKSAKPRRLGQRLLPALAVLTLSVVTLTAEDVFVTAYRSSTSGETTPCPPSCTTGTVSASGSSTYSTASPQPPISPRRSRFTIVSNPAPAWSVTPDNYGAYGTTALQSPGAYKIYITMPTLSNASTNLTVDMTATGGDLADTNQVASSSIPLDVFRRSSVANQWIFVGYITNSQPNPTVTFTYASGQLDGTTQNRWYIDAVRFENVGDPCFSSGASQVGVTGPLGAGGTEVIVTSVVAGATNVTVYANTVAIGATNNPAGFAAGNVVVPTSPLVQNDSITATQQKNSCTSTPSSAGLVGGGPNAQLRGFFTCWKNPTNAGPIGAASSVPASGFFYFLGAKAYSFGSAPSGGVTLPPGECWQQISLQNAVDDALDSNSATHVTNTDNFCSLEGMVLAIDSTDNGPYDVYIDRIMNGDTVIEDFESYADGTTNFFAAPSAASLPVPGAVYLGAPNSSEVSSNHAFDGAKACRVQWQWKDGSNVRWTHILANATAAKRYPQIDTRKPITARVLVLPVGSTTSHRFNGSVGVITSSATPVYPSTTNTLSVSATGSGPYTYQWSWEGGLLDNPSTSSAYVIDGGGAGVSSTYNGTYTVEVSDGTCVEKRTYSLLVVDPIPTITNQPAHAIINAGTTVAAMRVGADGHVPAGYPLTYLWRSNGVDITDQTLDTLWITNASLADVLAYDVIVGNSYGSVTSSIAYGDVVPVGITGGNGTGLRGDYRTAHFATNAFTGPPTLSRTDATVDFDWLTGAPDPAVSADNFTARWTGQVQALGTDDYTFHTISDDGVRLWVNGQLLVDQWIDHSPWTNSGNLTLTGTSKYDLTLEFYEKTGGAVSKLYWSSASGSVGFEPVPQSQLYPAPAGPLIPTVSHSLPDASHITFNWGVGTYNLAWATNILGPYTNIIYGVTSPHTETIGSEPQKYFRLLVQ